jgi:hypothetical protein
MGKTVRQAARATLQLGIAAAMAFGMYLFITVLLITAIATLAVVGAWMLPETVTLIRRIAGAKRHQVAAWTGRAVPEAYQPIEGTLRERLRIAVRDPGTHTDTRWMLGYYVYGASSSSRSPCGRWDSLSTACGADCSAAKPSSCR